MHNFNSKSTIYRKMVVMAGILLMMSFGLYVFSLNHQFLNSFQPYYAKAYAASFAFKLNNAFTGSGKVVHGQTFFAESVPVLLYHGIMSEPDGSNILLDDFREQLFALKKAGWQTININDFYAFMKGETTLPAKSFLLTFDDGRKDSYYPVDTFLKALDYDAVMFVITGRSLNDTGEEVYFHLDKKELESMKANGRWDIQSHSRGGHDLYSIDEEGTKGHFFGNKLWLRDKGRLETGGEFEARVTRDLLESKMDIEVKMNEDVISFAYPFGDYGQKTLNFPQAEVLVRDITESIYPVSFYQAWDSDPDKLNYPDSTKDTFFVKRINVRPDWSSQDLLAEMEG